MSPPQGVAALAASTRELADHVETTLERLGEARQQEAKQQDELFRALDPVHRELVTLPVRFGSSAKREYVMTTRAVQGNTRELITVPGLLAVTAARPSGVTAVTPSLSPVASTLRRVERARISSM